MSERQRANEPVEVSEYGDAESEPAGAGVSGEIDSYLDGVRAALVDLPAESRDELLEDLPAHLVEVSAEGTGSLVDRLGPPAAYAAELRAAAGLDAAVGSRRSAARTTTAVRRLRAAAEGADVRLGPVVGYPRLSDFGRLLRPAWVVLRGYLVGMIFLSAVVDDWELTPGALDGAAGSPLGWLVVLAFIAGSVRLDHHFARRTRPLPRFGRWLLGAATVLLGLVAVGGLLAGEDSVSGPGYTTVNDRTDMIQDVFVYDSAGRPLTGVQLFDQDGNPIMIGDPYRCRTFEELQQPNGPLWRYPLCPLGPGRVGATPEASRWVSTPVTPPSPAATSAAPSSPAPAPAGSAGSGAPAGPAASGSPQS